MIPALIVPVLNRPDLLRRLIASIDFPVGDLLVIDNGHVVGDLQAVPHVQRLHVLRMPTNLGVPASWNLGIKALPFAPWWLIVNSDAAFIAGSLERFATEARRDALVLSGGAPPWCAFALGDDVVAEVGLFDEGLFPAYFEDNDYQRRCMYHGYPVVQSAIPMHHDNSSTIRSDPKLAAANDRTFTANYGYYMEKVQRGDFGPGCWSLDTRRELAWER